MGMKEGLAKRVQDGHSELTQNGIMDGDCAA